MRYINKKHKKISFRFRIGIFFFFIISFILFFFCLQFTSFSKKETVHFTYAPYLLAPTCSSPSGFSTSEFALQLSTSINNGIIYYTLDGSEPTSTSIIYKHPIIIAENTSPNILSMIPTSPRWKPPIGDVFKGTVLRAVVVNEHNQVSGELVKTFFIDPKGSRRYTFPVISIVLNEKNFFGYHTGIYVLGKNYGDKDRFIRKNISLDVPWWEYPSNYLMRGEDAERAAHIEFYEPNGKLGFESNIGIRINGNATRGYAQKSLRICFRKKYGMATLYYDLFEGNKVKQFNSFILRNSGNDWDKTMFRDGLMQSLMKNTVLDIQDNKECVVFINGEYWGIHNIRERLDENYLSNKYGISPDSLAILESNGSVLFGKKTDGEEFRTFIDFVKKNDLSKPENYLYFLSRVDEQSLIDFLIANIYFCNSDWPNNNVKFWRYKISKMNTEASPRDGKWRWMLYDMDWGFGYNKLSDPENDLLPKASSVGSIGVLFKALKKNPEFVQKFTSRFQLLINSNFSSSHLLSLIDSTERVMGPEMKEHIDRWRIIGSYSDWLKNVQAMRKFASERPNYQFTQLNNFFDLKGKNQLRPAIQSH